MNQQPIDLFLQAIGEMERTILCLQTFIHDHAEIAPEQVDEEVAWAFIAYNHQLKDTLRGIYKASDQAIERNPSAEPA